VYYNGGKSRSTEEGKLRLQMRDCRQLKSSVFGVCVCEYIGCGRLLGVSSPPQSWSRSLADGLVAETLTWPCSPSPGCVLLHCATDGLSDLLNLTAAATRQQRCGILMCRWQFQLGDFCFKLDYSLCQRLRGRIGKKKKKKRGGLAQMRKQGRTSQFWI